MELQLSIIQSWNWGSICRILCPCLPHVGRNTFGWKYNTVITAIDLHYPTCHAKLLSQTMGQRSRQTTQLCGDAVWLGKLTCIFMFWLLHPLTKFSAIGTMFQPLSNQAYAKQDMKHTDGQMVYISWESNRNLFFVRVVVFSCSPKQVIPVTDRTCKQHRSGAVGMRNKE